MIFLGDIAHPFIDPPDWTELEVITERQTVVANFEGPLNDDLSMLELPLLFNHPSIVESLVNINTCIVTLANNHINDIENGISNTKQKLEERGILSVGAGVSFDEAASPSIMKEGDRDFVFLAFGWSTIQCNPAGACKAGTNPFSPKHVLESVQKAKKDNPKAYIVLLLHWNYELEEYPQPAHRQIAFAAVDLGADAVIGHHPHCVGGVEMYKNAVIAYSLGNWWLPQNIFFNGGLKYPSHTRRQMALEWTPGERIKLHWFEYDVETHSLAFQGSEDLDHSGRMTGLTPYSGMSHGDYKKWFKKNRVKRKLLPIYRDYDEVGQNWLFDRFVSLRHLLLLWFKGLLASLCTK